MKQEAIAKVLEEDDEILPELRELQWGWWEETDARTDEENRQDLVTEHTCRGQGASLGFSYLVTRDAIY